MIRRFTQVYEFLCILRELRMITLIYAFYTMKHNYYAMIMH